MYVSVFSILVIVRFFAPFPCPNKFSFFAILIHVNTNLWGLYEKNKNLQRPKLRKCKFIMTKNKHNILQGSKLKKKMSTYNDKNHALNQ